MSKHTAGPWNFTDKVRYCIYGAEDRHVALVSCYQVKEGDKEENLANARLIAAAPELLDEYKQLLAYLKAASEACLKGQSYVAEDLCHEYAEFNSPVIAKINGD